MFQHRFPKSLVAALTVAVALSFALLVRETVSADNPPAPPVEHTEIDQNPPAAAGARVIPDDRIRAVPDPAADEAHRRGNPQADRPIGAGP